MLEAAIIVWLIVYLALDHAINWQHERLRESTMIPSRGITTPASTSVLGVVEGVHLVREINVWRCTDDVRLPFCPSLGGGIWRNWFLGP